ncbi:DUF421 domain-containing protein [Parvularcula flava]|uniref:DUF421 domain-containing protein n=1 Tax=Aquisalinus luteolus TaxID=1566827 RepID=A0A8J3A371_9PROT|nr:YetF domain-containing protein [Aquisalinus luteolus]NHK27766.1 DUF421 domain-containing protein [Aquisalinus luteolus]GGH96435.1 DUF421 domain-containing protein [Aquisalinus luteolus]
MNEIKLFIDDQDTLWRILVTAPILYFAIIGFVRLVGKRATSQMNNFDWIVTVALGSLMASGILLKDVSILESLFAIGLLLALQYCLTFFAVRSDTVDNAIKAQPRLLVENGKLMSEAMRRERVTEQEVLAALREEGLRSIHDAKWVILESDASFSIIPRTEVKAADRSALKTVDGIPAR